jgi:hypothetical protein
MLLVQLEKLSLSERRTDKKRKKNPKSCKKSGTAAQFETTMI